MHEVKEPRINKWPFFIGDLLLVGAAGYFCWKAVHPLAPGTMALVLGCVVAGAVLSLIPFLVEFHAQTKIAEAGALTSVVSRIQELETVAAQIANATGQWQNIQEQSDKTAHAAGQLADRMISEVKGFSEFMERVSDREKSTLRLEVEKLRRAEADWLQVLVRMMDHVYALHVGALRSCQPTLIEQVGHFQNACREAVRRVGLTPFTAQQSEPFDGQRHQLADDSKPVANATIAETIATGYTFQGRLLRPALVKLANGNGQSTAHEVGH